MFQVKLTSQLSVLAAEAQITDSYVDLKRNIYCRLYYWNYRLIEKLNSVVGSCLSALCYYCFLCE